MTKITYKELDKILSAEAERVAKMKNPVPKDHNNLEIPAFMRVILPGI